MQHSYAGANANGANLESLREAQEMQQAGADMESIRKATGWHEGMDGKWRFEINDSRMQLRTDAADIPIYALSADAFVEDERLSRENGMNGHLTKPIDFDALWQIAQDIENRKETAKR